MIAATKRESKYRTSRTESNENAIRSSTDEMFCDSLGNHAKLDSTYSVISSSTQQYKMPVSGNLDRDFDLLSRDRNEQVSKYSLESDNNPHMDKVLSPRSTPFRNANSSGSRRSNRVQSASKSNDNSTVVINTVDPTLFFGDHNDLEDNVSPRQSKSSNASKRENSPSKKFHAPFKEVVLECNQSRTLDTLGNMYSSRDGIHHVESSYSNSLLSGDFPSIDKTI